MTAAQLRALPEDGIIDPFAVEIAASGSRRVRLTRAERQAAAATILASGGSPHLIATRLHVSATTARNLANDCANFSPGATE